MDTSSNPEKAQGDCARTLSEHHCQKHVFSKLLEYHCQKTLNPTTGRLGGPLSSSANNQRQQCIFREPKGSLWTQSRSTYSFVRSDLSTRIISNLANWIDLDNLTTTLFWPSLLLIRERLPGLPQGGRLYRRSSHCIKNSV